MVDNSVEQLSGVGFMGESFGADKLWGVESTMMVSWLLTVYMLVHHE